MKRVALILCVYAIIVFGICTGATFIYGGLPQLNVGEENTYRMFRALDWFLNLLPSILLSGFIISCCVMWKRNTENSRKRFSPAMFMRYRNVMIVSLFLVLIITLNRELFEPHVSTKLGFLSSGPVELARAKETARSLLAADEPDLAYPYAKRATLIAKNDRDAAELLVQVKNAADLSHDRELHEVKAALRAQEEMPVHYADLSLSVRECLEKSRASAAEENWFNAHYWAMLAVQGCSGTDPSLSEATQAANDAWRELQNPSAFGNEEEYAYYMRKMNAYAALKAGNTSDNLKAYYMFLELSNDKRRSSSDPDVEKFFALAREAVENDFFFIDETENIDLLKNNQNIYFSLYNKYDNTQNVFFICSVMDRNEDGRTGRYLEGLTVVTYSKYGKFLRSMYAPIAKVVPQPVSAFTEDALETYGIEKSWKNVPFIMLKAVDRETMGHVIAPEYSYVETGIPENVRSRINLSAWGSGSSATSNAQEAINRVRFADREDERTMILPMSFSDFTAINSAAGGPEKMDLYTLAHFLGRVTKYGFSYEVFSENFICRCIYPLFMLVLLIFGGVIGWNYRVENAKSQFKFCWIFLVPVFTAIVYLAIEVLTYIFSVVNYVFVGLFAGGAVIASFVLFVIILAVASIVFLARYEA